MIVDWKKELIGAASQPSKLNKSNQSISASAELLSLIVGRLRWRLLLRGSLRSFTNQQNHSTNQHHHSTNQSIQSMKLMIDGCWWLLIVDDCWLWMARFTSSLHCSIDFINFSIWLGANARQQPTFFILPIRKRRMKRKFGLLNGLAR